jgi:hypothetical protein
MLDEFVNFNSIAKFDELYSYVVAFITFLSMLKCLKLLRFDRRITLLSRTLQYAANDLFSFAFVFVIFILAYAQLGFALLGATMSKFRNFPSAIATCFRMLMGEINPTDIVNANRFYGKLFCRLFIQAMFVSLKGTFYFVSFTLLVFIALLSIFLTMFVYSIIILCLSYYLIFSSLED